MEYNTQDFVSKLEAMGITLTDEQVQQFITYYEMLVEKNKVMNLTGITEFDEVLEKHFEDSLSLIRVVDLNQNFKIMDLGTGAGFPGIPLKILERVLPTLISLLQGRYVATKTLIFLSISFILIRFYTYYKNSPMFGSHINQ